MQERRIMVWVDVHPEHLLRNATAPDIYVGEPDFRAPPGVHRTIAEVRVAADTDKGLKRSISEDMNDLRNELFGGK